MEDLERGFLPTPGRLTRWSPPSEGPDVRIDTFVREGAAAAIQQLPAGPTL